MILSVRNTLPIERLAILALVTCPLAYATAPPRPAPPLPPLSDTEYNIIEIDTAQELTDAAWNLSSNQAIVIAPGVYDLANTTFPNGVDGRITVGRFGATPIQNIQIRGSTGNPDDVIIRGAGMLDPIVPHGIQIFTARDVTLADFSIGEVYFHAIMLQGNQGANDIRIYNVRAFDAGQQIIKGSGAGADDVTVEYSRIEYTDGAEIHPEAASPNTCYTNGIDVTGGKRWVIRDNRISRIRCKDTTLAGPAILIWQGAADTIIERNLILESSRGISLGLVNSSDHTGGIVRNNLIRWDPAATYAVDVPIYTTSPNARIAHNTALTEGTYPNAIEVRFNGTTDVVVSGNLLDASIAPRNDASPMLQDNEVNASVTWFTDVVIGDLRLNPAGLQSVPLVMRDQDVLIDCLAQARPVQTRVGACEVNTDDLFADGFETR